MHYKLETNSQTITMKKTLLIAIIFLSHTLINAQAYSGKGDKKLQIGANFQENASGIHVSFDQGIGENISLGISSSYVLGFNSSLVNPDFSDRIDVRARFNANLGSVFNIDQRLDIYPGLSFGLKNFGGHLGGRYFFSNGFGVYTEFNAPFAKYKTGRLTYAEKLHNRFSVNLGAVFNL